MTLKHIYIICLSALSIVSCAKQDAIDDDATAPVEGNAPLTINVSAGSIKLQTRGSGTIGDMKGDGDRLVDQYGNALDNQTPSAPWDGQTLNFCFLKKGTLELGEVSGLANSRMGIPFTANGSSASPESMLTYGGDVLDIYGYYIDDDDNDVDNDNEGEEDDVLSIPFTIDGSQDVMCGKADPENDCKDKGISAESTYSNGSARKGVVPSIAFKHMLTRFTFSVEPGGEKGEWAKYSNEKSGDNITKNPDALHILSVGIKSSDKGRIQLASNEADFQQHIEWETAEDAEGNDNRPYLYLKDRKSDELNPVAPMYELTGDGDVKDSSVVKQPLGEALLVQDEQSEIDIELKTGRWVESNDNDGDGDNSGRWEEAQTFNFTISPQRYNKDLPEGTLFKAGESYNINFLLKDGFVQIVMPITLKDENGDDVDFIFFQSWEDPETNPDNNSEVNVEDGDGTVSSQEREALLAEHKNYIDAELDKLDNKNSRIVTDAKSKYDDDIENAKNKSDYDLALARYLNSLKEAYKKELSDKKSTSKQSITKEYNLFVADYSSMSDDVKAKLDKFFEDYKAKITNAKDKDTVDTLKDAFPKALEDKYEELLAGK